MEKNLNKVGKSCNYQEAKTQSRIFEVMLERTPEKKAS